MSPATAESLVTESLTATKSPATTKFKEVKTKPTHHPTHKSLHRWLDNFLTWLSIALIVVTCALLVSFITCSLFVWTKKSKFNILTILKVLFLFYFIAKNTSSVIVELDPKSSSNESLEVKTQRKIRRCYRRSSRRYKVKRMVDDQEYNHHKDQHEKCKDQLKQVDVLDYDQPKKVID